MLAAVSNAPPGKLYVRKLFIVARDDASGDGPRLPGIREQYEKALVPLQKMMGLHGHDADGFSRHEVLMLVAECRLQLRRVADSLAVLDLAAREAKERNEVSVKALRHIEGEFQPLTALAAAVEMHENRLVAHRRYISA